MERVCESCGGEDEELVLVRGAGPDGSADGAPTELWCFACRSERPHEVVDDRG